MINEGIRKILLSYPLLSLKPSCDGSIIVEGELDFKASSNGQRSVEDSYFVKIRFPCDFPRSLPKVWELKNKIPRRDDGEFHVNSDGTLCLGSPIRLLEVINKESTEISFIATCLIPFLYGVSLKLDNGEKFYMGELDHGKEGLFKDYMELFCLTSKEQVILIVESLSYKKRIANKKKCPCCVNRLGRCNKRFKVNSIRRLTSQSWFKNHLKEFVA